MDRNAAIGEAITREIRWAERERAEVTGELSRLVACEGLVARLNALMAPLGGSAKYRHPGAAELVYPDGTIRHPIWT